MSDWQSLDQADRAAVRALVTRATAHDGVAAVGEHVLAELELAQAVLVRAGAEVVGIAIRVGTDPAEIVVDPGSRRQGIGTDLVSRALTSDSGRPDPAVWAHGDLAPARALAGRLGLRVSRELLQLSRPLGRAPLPEPVWPDGVLLRTFRPGEDEDAFLAVNARAFAWHPEQGRLDRAGLAAEMRQQWFDPAGFFLAVPAEHPGRVLGFHWTKIHPPQGGAAAIGEVYVIAVDPQSPIRRLGEPLTLAGLEYLAGRGLSEVILYVEGDNVPARRLYDRLGFRPARVDRTYSRG